MVLCACESDSFLLWLMLFLVEYCKLAALFNFNSTTIQFYCNTCNRFLADRFVEGTCPFPNCNYDSARGDQCEKCSELLNPIELKDPRCKVCVSSIILISASAFFFNVSLVS